MAGMERKKGSMQCCSKPEAEQIWHENAYYVKWTTPVAILIFVLAWLPQLSHVRYFVLTLALGTGGLIALSVWLVQTDDVSVLPLHAKKVCWYSGCIRICVLCCAILWYNDDTFARCVSMFALPISKTRHEYHHVYHATGFKVYLGVHMLLNILRFWNNLAEGAPWIFSVFIVCELCQEVVTHTMSLNQRQLKLYDAYTLLDRAELIAATILDNCSDAVVTLDPELCVLEDSPQLKTLIGRTVKGGAQKKFVDLIDMADRETFSSHMKDRIESMDASYSDSSEDGDAADTQLSTLDRFSKRIKRIGAAPTVTRKRPDVSSSSFRVHLMDSYSIAVPVNVLHVCCWTRHDTIKHMLGISEAWQPKEPKDRSKRSGAKSKDAKHQVKLDFETGQLHPTAPMFPTGAGQGVEVSQSAATSLLMSTGADRDSNVSQRRRPDSPRPNKRS